ncbi:MAG: hypothetical protein J5I90_06485 [Caldilineales bacterium]|nr:hypothetical protein [Caldilineales bacterium]
MTSNTSPKRLFDFVDLLFAAGFVLITAGLVGYDWRIAAVVCGLLLLALGLFAAWRSAPSA